MKVRVWRDPDDGTSRIFDPEDWSVRVCTPEEAAQAIADRARQADAQAAALLHEAGRLRSRTTTSPIKPATLDHLVEQTRLPQDK